ncbi:MAG TPA: glycosyltransferase [Tepidisphaeraceae bacterium]|jgi:glycosyltransferase involved in cell wall biosynthesis|nr:glycosyltransferase [Tepidisphaeraceae bacterium]
MKSLLYIGSGAPWAGGAGYLIRQRMFLRALAQVAELHLAMFDAPADAEASVPSYVKTLTPLPRVSRKMEEGLGRLCADFLSPTPRMFRGPRPAAARKVVANLHPENFDAVFAFRIDFAHFAGVLNHPRLLLDIDDPEHLRWRRQLAATTQTGGDWRTLRDLGKLARFEKRAAAGAVASFVCQEHDRAAFNPPPVVVPNCVDVPAICPPRNAEKPRIIFLGNFAAASPNLDGLNWVLDEIWPLIRALVADCELHIVGRVNEQMQQRIGEIDGAVARGFVENLPAAMAEASLSIAPIRFGTGTRVKIIESFALGCPVVSTTLGAEGIDARAGEQILLGDTPADFATQCVKLLRDRDAQARIAAGGYALAASRYSEEARRPELAATLADLLARCGGDSATPPMRTAPRQIAAL